MQNGSLARSRIWSEQSPTLEWELLTIFPPQKIFLWDKWGIYLDCQFPNPVHGHFFGGKDILGAHIREVLPSTVSPVVLRAHGETLARQCPTVVRIHFEIEAVTYYTLIRFIPMHEFVIGWANDFLMHAYFPEILRGIPQEKYWIPQNLTFREWEIALFIANEQSTAHIAQCLKISQRTVKFHVTHILEKLQLTSRTQVKALLNLLA